MGANAQTEVPTFTAGQILTAAQMNVSARTGVPVFATTTTRDAAFGGTGEKTLAEGQLCYLESTKVVQYYDGSSWLPVSLFSALNVATVATSQGVTSATYTDLATVGPQVTVTTGTSVLVIISCGMTQGAGADTNWGINASFDVTGASSVAASDANCLSLMNSGSPLRYASRVVRLTGLTAGSNTFTMKYKRINQGTGTFADRTIMVINL